MKKNGFMSMSLIYAFFIVFVAIMLSLLLTYTNDRILGNRISKDIIETQDKNSLAKCSYAANETILNKSTTFAYLDETTQDQTMTTTISNSIKLICPGFYKITVKSRKGEDSTSGKTGGKGGIAQAIFYFNSQTLVQYAVGAQTYIRLYENDGYIDPLFTTKGNDATTSANGSNGSKTVLKRDYILEATLSTNNTTTSQVLIVYLGEQI